MSSKSKKKFPTCTEVGPQAALITPPPLLVGGILIGKSYAGNSYFSGAIKCTNWYEWTNDDSECYIRFFERYFITTFSRNSAKLSTNYVIVTKGTDLFLQLMFFQKVVPNFSKLIG